MKICFASDNTSGIHPQVLESIKNVNQDSHAPYGDDEITLNTIALFKKEFGNDSEVYFVFNGTGANVISLQVMTKSFHSILCSSVSHINMDECGAPEKFTGCKLITIPHQNGKLTIDALESAMIGIGDQHHNQPKVVSLSQTTEFGTVYSVEELKNISKFCKKNSLYLHMDGARIANAAVSLQKSIKEITLDCGVDILTFGGTKSGLMIGEAVVILNPNLKENFKFIRKQSMQLYSKMRFISTQFNAYFSNDLWKKNALHANQITKYFEQN